MVLSLFSCVTDETRLVRHQDTLYKLKVAFENVGAPLNEDVLLSLQTEVDEVVRAVLYMVENDNGLVKIQTDHFLAVPSLSIWKAGQMLEFKEDGKVLDVGRNAISITFSFCQTQSSEKETTVSQGTSRKEINLTSFDAGGTAKGQASVNTRKPSESDDEENPLAIRNTTRTAQALAVATKVQRSVGSQSETGLSTSAPSVPVTRNESEKNLETQKTQQRDQVKSPKTASSRLTSASQAQVNTKSTQNDGKVTAQNYEQNNTRQHVQKDQNLPETVLSRGLQTHLHTSAQQTSLVRRSPRIQSHYLNGSNLQQAGKLSPKAPRRKQSQQASPSIPKSATESIVHTGYELRSRSHSPEKRPRLRVGVKRKRCASVSPRKLGSRNTRTRSTTPSSSAGNSKKVKTCSVVTVGKRLRQTNNLKIVTRMASNKLASSSNSGKEYNELRLSPSTSEGKKISRYQNLPPARKSPRQNFAAEKKIISRRNLSVDRQTSSSNQILSPEKKTLRPQNLSPERKNSRRQPDVSTSSHQKPVSASKDLHHTQQQTPSPHHSPRRYPQRARRIETLRQTIRRNTVIEEERLSSLSSSQRAVDHQLPHRLQMPQAQTFEQKDPHVVEEGDLQEELKLQMLAGGDAQAIKSSGQRGVKRKSSLMQMFTDNVVSSIKRALRSWRKDLSS